MNDALLNIGAQAMADAAGFLSIHTALPDGSGSSESAAARVAAAWTTPTGSGDFGTTNRSFTGGAASGAATYVGLWSASSGGIFYGAYPLTGDQTFNAAGQYTLTSLTLDGSHTP